MNQHEDSQHPEQDFYKHLLDEIKNGRQNITSEQAATMKDIFGPNILDGFNLNITPAPDAAVDHLRSSTDETL